MIFALWSLAHHALEIGDKEVRKRFGVQIPDLLIIFSGLYVASVIKVTSEKNAIFNHPHSKAFWKSQVFMDFLNAWCWLGLCGREAYFPWIPLWAQVITIPSRCFWMEKVQCWISPGTHGNVRQAAYSLSILKINIDGAVYCGHHFHPTWKIHNRVPIQTRIMLKGWLQWVVNLYWIEIKSIKVGRRVG